MVAKVAVTVTAADPDRVVFDVALLDLTDHQRRVAHEWWNQGLRDPAAVRALIESNYYPVGVNLDAFTAAGIPQRDIPLYLSADVPGGAAAILATHGVVGVVCCETFLRAAPFDGYDLDDFWCHHVRDLPTIFAAVTAGVRGPHLAHWKNVNVAIGDAVELARRGVQPAHVEIYRAAGVDSPRLMAVLWDRGVTHLHARRYARRGARDLFGLLRAHDRRMRRQAITGRFDDSDLIER